MCEQIKSEKQLQLDIRYLRMATIWSENSYCVRRQVGALLVKNGMIISDGYNGTPTGFENVCELDDGTTKPYVLHAEANAITKIARTSVSSENSTLYVTASPCIECAKLIIQSGIKRVVYADEYRIMDGVELLKRAGIEVLYIDIDNSEEIEEYCKISPRRFQRIINKHPRHYFIDKKILVDSKQACLLQSLLFELGFEWGGTLKGAETKIQLIEDIYGIIIFDDHFTFTNKPEHFDDHPEKEEISFKTIFR